MKGHDAAGDRLIGNARTAFLSATTCLSGIPRPEMVVIERSMYDRTVDHRFNSAQTVGAFLIAVAAIGLTGSSFDPTPLLTEPSPDLDWPLGLLGIAMGLWSAYTITSLAYCPKATAGRVGLWIMLPLFLSFGVAALGNRVHEAISFRSKTQKVEMTVSVAGRDRSTSRAGRVSYEASVVNPLNGGRVTVRVDEATFNRIEPTRECATLLIERAPNGAARLLMPLRWKVRCP